MQVALKALIFKLFEFGALLTASSCLEFRSSFHVGRDLREPLDIVLIQSLLLFLCQPLAFYPALHVSRLSFCPIELQNRLIEAYF